MINEERFRQILSETDFRASRSSGAGGQHVNKVSSRMTLTFNVKASMVLSDEEKSKILQRLSSKITLDGAVQVHAQESRSQHTNKEEAINKLRLLLNSALRERKKRKATKPSRSSKEKRLDEKRHRAEVKRGRRRTKDF